MSFIKTTLLETSQGYIYIKKRRIKPDVLPSSEMERKNNKGNESTTQEPAGERQHGKL